MLRDRPIVGISLLDVGVTSGEMGGDEAEACVMVVQSDAYGTLVS